MWSVCQENVSKSLGTFRKPVKRALNQAAHSHDASPASSLLSQVTQMYGSVRR